MSLETLIKLFYNGKKIISRAAFVGFVIGLTPMVILLTNNKLAGMSFSERTVIPLNFDFREDLTFYWPVIAILANVGLKFFYETILCFKIIPVDYASVNAKALKEAMAEDPNLKYFLKRKMYTNLKPEEFETFDVLLESFEGSVNDLILSSKHLS